MSLQVALRFRAVQPSERFLAVSLASCCHRTAAVAWQTPPRQPTGERSAASTQPSARARAASQLLRVTPRAVRGALAVRAFPLRAAEQARPL